MSKCKHEWCQFVGEFSLCYYCKFCLAIAQEVGGRMVKIMDKLKQKIIEILDETLQVGEGVSFHYYDKDNSAIDQIMTLIAQDRAELISKIQLWCSDNSYSHEKLMAYLSSLEADAQKGKDD